MDDQRWIFLPPRIRFVSVKEIFGQWSGEIRRIWRVRGRASGALAITWCPADKGYNANEAPKF